MEQNRIIFAGLEPDYMKRLTLYLTERFGPRIQVGICREPFKEELQESGIWVTSAELGSKLRQKCPGLPVILITEDKTTEEESIFPYQSREKLYRELLRQMAKLRGITEEAGNEKQQILTITGDVAPAKLLAFSTACAEQLGQDAPVLYLNFSQCSGMEQMLCLEQEEHDLGELLLLLRKERPVCLEAYTGRLEHFDYLLPAWNPMVLQEFTWEDMQRLFSLIQKSSHYTWIVVSFGCVMCGCDLIFAKADRMFHISGSGLLHECGRQAWQNLLQHCRGAEELHLEQVGDFELSGGSPGPHLIMEWTNGSPGRMAKRMLQQGISEPEPVAVQGRGKGTVGSLADYPGTDSWRS